MDDPKMTTTEAILFLAARIDAQQARFSELRDAFMRVQQEFCEQHVELEALTEVVKQQGALLAGRNANQRN
jgi:hypothetical protein